MPLEIGEISDHSESSRFLHLLVSVFRVSVVRQRIAERRRSASLLSVSVTATERAASS